MVEQFLMKGVADMTTQTTLNPWGRAYKPDPRDQKIIADIDPPILSLEELRQMLSGELSSLEKRLAETAFLLHKVILKLKGDEP